MCRHRAGLHGLQQLRARRPRLRHQQGRTRDRRVLAAQQPALRIRHNGPGGSQMKHKQWCEDFRDGGAGCICEPHTQTYTKSTKYVTLEVTWPNPGYPRYELIDANGWSMAEFCGSFWSPDQVRAAIKGLVGDQPVEGIQ